MKGQMMNAVAKKETPSDLRETQNGAASRNFVSPEVNIFETKDGYVLEAELPGVNKEGLDITLEGNELTIEGRRPQEPVAGNAVYRESQVWDYRRVFELDPAIDATKLNAKLEQGVLTLHLPKSEKVKPRKVTIN
jgi:HSP20 family protein